MATKKKLQKMTLLSAIITLISFAYKLTISIITMSTVMIVASVSSFLVFICKAIFVKNVFETRAKKKKAYLFMLLSVLIYSLIFIAFVVLKVNGIDIHKEVPFDGLLGILFIALLFVLFILSILGLKGALEKTDLMVIGLKEMTFISALADLVMIEEFVSLIVLKYVDIPNMDMINGYFSLGVGALMVLVAFIMLIRFIKYRPNN